MFHDFADITYVLDFFVLVFGAHKFFQVSI